jgi:hypothetical protein
LLQESFGSHGGIAENHEKLVMIDDLRSKAKLGTSPV